MSPCLRAGAEHDEVLHVFRRQRLGRGRGVTPQAVIAAAGIPYAVSHTPGQMFISDVPEATWALA